MDSSTDMIRRTMKMHDQRDPTVLGEVILRLVELGTPTKVAADLADQTVTEASQETVSRALRNGAASDLPRLFAALHRLSGGPR